MNEIVSAIVTGGAGVAAALVPAVLAQRGSDRVRRRETARHEREREGVLRTLEARRALDRRRAGYADLNTAARHYLTELTNLLHALRRREDVQPVVARLEAARAAHLAGYGSAQLIASEPVLDAAHRVNRQLNALYGMLRRIAEDAAADTDSPDAAQRDITALWDTDLAFLRRTMRADLRPTETASPRQ